MKRAEELPEVIRPVRDFHGVETFVTTRAGGVSSGAYRSLNLAQHVSDADSAVAENRRRLRAYLPAEPWWLDQVHGCEVAVADGARKPVGARRMRADAIVTREPGVVLSIMVADCLPVLLVGDGEIALVHAGWRGLASGVILAAVRAMSGPPHTAWLGPAIGGCHYEVDQPVRDALAGFPTAFSAGRDASHWALDLGAVAKRQLLNCGVSAVTSVDLCTYCDARLFSHRRENPCGRMAMLAWLR